MTERAKQFKAAKLRQIELEQEYKAASDALNAIPGVCAGPMGLTAYHVRSTPEYLKARKRCDLALGALRQFNGEFLTKYKTELRQERRVS